MKASRFLPAAFLALFAPLTLSADEAREKTVHDALYSEKPVVIDGKLDDPVWQKAKVYPMNVAWKTNEPHLPLSEKGNIRLAWDEEYLYLAADLEDLDLVAEAEGDQLHHYKTGDTMELFLRPPGNRWYWELYGTPRGDQTSFFFPSRGRVFLPSSEKSPMKMKVAAVMDGTLNDWKDKDKGWTLEMAVPIKDLTAHGDIIAEGAPAWHILISRYNYSAYHEVRGAEFSSTSPSFGDASFHNFDVWSKVRFVKDGQKGEEKKAE